MDRRDDPSPLQRISDERASPVCRERDDEGLRLLGRKEVLPGSWPGGTRMRVVLPRRRSLLILTLAANTSYADFPRLASLPARDDFLPHQFAYRGDLLAFSSGILFLAALASVLLIVFQSKTTQLINLYAVGVFVSFTLSQSGMVCHWWRLRGQQRKWQRSLLLNGLGALTTLTVSLVIATTKFLEGAWIVVLLIPLLVLLFLGISRHYRSVEYERVLADVPFGPEDIRHRFVVPVIELNLLAKSALVYARSISPYVQAVHVANRKEHTAALRAAWDQWQQHAPPSECFDLQVLDPGHRGLLLTLLAFLRERAFRFPGETLTVILPETGAPLWKRLFFHPTTLKLKTLFFFQPHLVVTNIPFQQHAPSRQLPISPDTIRHRFIVPVADLDRAAIQSLAYARSISSHVVAVHVALDEQGAEHIRAHWRQFQEHLPGEERVQLVIIESPYRALLYPLLAYIDIVQDMHPDERLTIILPELVAAHWWEQLLHSQIALRLKAALLARPGIVVTDIPQHLHLHP